MQVVEMDLRNFVWGNFLANWLMCWLMRAHNGMLERKRWGVTSSSLVVSFQTLFKMLVKLGDPTLVCRGAAPPRFLPRPCWPPWCNPALRFLQQSQTHSSSELPSTLQDASVCKEPQTSQSNTSVRRSEIFSLSNSDFSKWIWNQQDFWKNCFSTQ